MDTALKKPPTSTAWWPTCLMASRLEGALRLNKEPCDLADVAGAALSHLGERLSSFRCVNIPEDLPMVPMDFVMMNQVLVNVLDNAVKYSAWHAYYVDAGLQSDGIGLSIADEGIGIPPEDLERVFNLPRPTPGSRQRYWPGAFDL
jgi:two-component system sensor histidine kinase KdpD